MPKKYNLSDKASMRRFSKDLEAQVLDIARSKAMTMRHSVNCPHCHFKIEVSAGKSLCPVCGKEIDLQIT